MAGTWLRSVLVYVLIGGSLYSHADYNSDLNACIARETELCRKGFWEFTKSWYGNFGSDRAEAERDSCNAQVYPRCRDEARAANPQRQLPQRPGQDDPQSSTQGTQDLVAEDDEVNTQPRPAPSRPVSPPNDTEIVQHPDCAAQGMLYNQTTKLCQPATQQPAPAPTEDPRIAEQRQIEEAEKAAYEQQTQEVSQIGYAYQACKEEFNKTEKCCEHPESCIAEALGGKSGDGNAAYKALQMVGTLAGAVPAASIGQVCGRMKDVATGFTVLNTALAATCEAKVQKCTRTCEEVANQARAKIQELEAYPSTNIAGQVRPGLLAKLGRYVDESDNCKRFNNAVMEKAAQAVASAYSAKMAKTCKEVATNGEKALNTNSFDVDCTNVANAANPVCQAACNRQGWENDPVCVAANGGLRNNNNNPLGGSGGGAGDRAPNNPLGDLDLSEDPQTVEEQAVAQQDSNGISTGQGGGGFDTGGAGGMGGAGSAGGGGQGGGGYDKNVIAGLRTGGGYSMPSSRSNFGGGYSGGSFGSRKPTSDGKPFNPKDFLPGGRLDPKRKLAGLSAATAAGVGAVHGNIFTNISNRFYQVCLRDGLMDCSTLRKRGRVGNN